MEVFKSYFEEIELALKNFTKELGEPKELYEPISYMMQLGGKRIRPLLTLLGCEIFSNQPFLAIHQAIGIELFHNFTLLHDDIMDKAPVRRGKETVFKKWNQNIAILAGDVMFVKAIESFIKDNQHITTTLVLFNQTAIEVCEGQQYDMNFETSQHVTLEAYLQMIRLKTAVLLGCSLKTGAIIGGADQKAQNALFKIGENMGLAFQLMDDYLDVFGNPEKFGKQIGGDIITNKKTFLYLTALNNANESQKNRLITLYNQNDKTNEEVNEVIDLFKALSVDTFTFEKMNTYYKEAINLFETLPETSATEKLKRLLSYYMHRES
ncbi:MAG: polyprenyl synthetase family protein [Vicingaceae bacterium]